MNIEELSKDPNKIKDLIAMLSSLLPTQEQNNSTTDTIPTKKINTKQKRENLFLSMPESKMHKDDCEIDKKLQKYPPTLRNREINYITVKCRVCGKSEDITESLVDSRDRYKCNNCSRSPG
jgi:hypothetical protein